MKGAASSASRRVKSEKKEKEMNKNEDVLLLTRYEFLKENHETLQRDYASLEESLKLINELHDVMKLEHQKQIRDFEAENRRLLECFEKERNEQELKIEEVKRIENELKVVKKKNEEEMEKMEKKYVERAEEFDEVVKECDKLRSMFQEARNLINGKEQNVTDSKPCKDDDVEGKNNTETDGFGVVDMEISDMEPHNVDAVNLVDEETNNDAGTERFDVVEPNFSDSKLDNENDKVIVVEENVIKTVKQKIGACSNSKSRYDDENEEVIVVDVKKPVIDTIMISDDDDDNNVEYHNPPRANHHITPPQSTVMGVKQEQQSDAPKSSTVSHPSSLRRLPSLSSSSSSSDETLFVQFPVKRSRDGNNKS